MAQVFNQSNIREHEDLEQQYWIYNGLDCVITRALWDKLSPHTEKPYVKTAFNFVTAMQAPALEMMQRGLLVDQEFRTRIKSDLERKRKRLQFILDSYGAALWGKGINANSPTQLAQLFYGILECPEQHKYEKGEKKISTNAEAMEKLSERYMYARPIANAVLALRDVVKQLGVVNSGVSEDGRLRASYNIVGTETGRWSSSENVWGGGTNLQNITDHLRRMFIADEGWKFAYVDLEQAESRLVAYLSGDEAYIDACESGDLHTTVCRMVWKELGWTGELKHDKGVIAAQNFYRHFSYRDMAKRGGHGTNYYGTPRTMAMHLKIESKIMESFQAEYFSAFPNIPDWHRWVAQQLQTVGYLETPHGRRRYFHSRLGEDTTLREGIAFVPQSAIGEILNLALWLVWKRYGTVVQILGQVHDAILFQYREETESEILPAIMQCMTIPFPIKDIHGKERTCTIPVDCEVGWTWQHYDYSNPDNVPDGMKKWSGKDGRTRTTKTEYDMLRTVLS